MVHFIASFSVLLQLFLIASLGFLVDCSEEVNIEEGEGKKTKTKKTKTKPSSHMSARDSGIKHVVWTDNTGGLTTRGR